MNQRGRRPITAHTHTGPRIGATATELFLYSCQVCGIKFVEGTEDLNADEMRFFNEAFAPELRED